MTDWRHAVGGVMLIAAGGCSYSVGSWGTHLQSHDAVPSLGNASGPSAQRAIIDTDWCAVGRSAGRPAAHQSAWIKSDDDSACGLYLCLCGHSITSSRQCGPHKHTHTETERERERLQQLFPPDYATISDWCVSRTLTFCEQRRLQCMESAVRSRDKVFKRNLDSKLR